VTGRSFAPAPLVLLIDAVNRPHFLRVAQALALVSGVTPVAISVAPVLTGCGGEIRGACGNSFCDTPGVPDPDPIADASPTDAARDDDVVQLRFGYPDADDGSADDSAAPPDAIAIYDGGPFGIPPPPGH
jgi:hypothetical protein